MSADKPVTATRELGANRYFVTLSTHGRRALLTGGSLPHGQVPTPLGNAVAAAWLALPRELPGLATEALYLTPDSICAVVTVSGTDTPASLRLLNSAVRHFKASTTRLLNNGSTQDYHSRLWAAAYRWGPLDTPDAATALGCQLAAEGACMLV